ncbi:DNA methyltransferase [Atopococcus tabaci]|uniref:DNA methyltransferase n=1 Tax=Atopococcus tabaci TaxID=269774 RepID=UPI0003F9D59D|nr:DNA methyltransferase [Atopococcus tabaci]
MKQTYLKLDEEKSPIKCLGMTFRDEDERREYFRNELRKELDRLKKIDGYPMGNDEDIIALSDPPYYTACPNPWVSEMIEEWVSKKEDLETYDVEPYFSDVSEGKNDKIYMAHTYHTKVPYKAIMKYLYHYTKPGDIVLDAFGGTGMTALAAHECGNEELCYEMGLDKEKLGKRRAVVSDLAPAATFISSSYTKNFSDSEFQRKMLEIMEEIKDEIGELFLTEHYHNQLGEINYAIWSEFYSCPNCGHEYDYYSMTYDEESKISKKQFSCPECSIILNKKTGEKVWTLKYDPITKTTRKIAKMEPVSINYTFRGKRYTKKPDTADLRKLHDAQDLILKMSGLVVQELPEGVNTRQPEVSHGYRYLHDLYSSRNYLFVLMFVDKIEKLNIRDKGLFLLTSALQNSSFLYRWRANGKGGILSGTYYICSTPQENNVFSIFKRKLKDIGFVNIANKDTIISTNSATDLSIQSNTIDYIFTDPPFGANLMYSELNFLWEGWLKVVSNNSHEAIVNAEQKKNVNDYHELITYSFKEYYRVLKPGRWITIEFSNSQANIWNSIQDSIQKAGFIIANVAALDKKQGSFKAVTSTTAVKQDLVISAYKPIQADVEKMKKEIDTQESAWTFVTQHLAKLPVFQGKKGEAVTVTERTPRILFDRMVAYHIQTGLPVPISSADFQQQVAQKYPMRDGMIFLDSQVAEYDKKRILVKEFAQQSLFVSDENSAIEWLRQQLMKKPQTRQDIHPLFMKEIQHIAKHEELPELDNLLNQNFLLYEGIGNVPSQIKSYLTKNYHDMRGLSEQDDILKKKAANRWYVPDPNKQADLEQLREKSLLREFQQYVEETKKSKRKLKTFRTEAIRVGFKHAWNNKEYEEIVEIGERLPEKIIQEDDKLLMYFDNAQIRLGI